MHCKLGQDQLGDLVRDSSRGQIQCLRWLLHCWFFTRFVIITGRSSKPEVCSVTFSHICHFSDAIKRHKTSFPPSDFWGHTKDIHFYVVQSQWENVEAYQTYILSWLEVFLQHTAHKAALVSGSGTENLQQPQVYDYIFRSNMMSCYSKDPRSIGISKIPTGDPPPAPELKLLLCVFSRQAGRQLEKGITPQINVYTRL